MSVQFFHDPNHKPQPKEQIRIESLKATPYEDRYRVFIEVSVTPFLERPNLLLAARTAEGRLVADMDVIATMHSSMEFTMHIRGLDDPTGSYTLTAELYYETRRPPQDKREVTFTIPPEDDSP